MAQLVEFRQSDLLVEVLPRYTDKPCDEKIMRRFHDDEDETGSQVSSTINLEDLEVQRQSNRDRASQTWWSRFGCCRQRREETDAERRARRIRWYRGCGISVVVLTIFGTIAAGRMYQHRSRYLADRGRRATSQSLLGVYNQGPDDKEPIPRPVGKHSRAEKCNNSRLAG
ncbi:hypothetical protein IG631_00346 [Alternaria alternata]|nr:hypothetical protein IG631_00346 [Alternaria alternata]